MQKLGNVSEKEMFRTFNMGIGMVMVCSETDKQSLLKSVAGTHEIGRVITGHKRVQIS
jgi:phosphoribosylformylglycinamidine cyclo-ligase